MEIATSQSLSRIWRLALVGTATAFAWIVLSLLLGLGSGHAQATEGDDDKGLLGAVTSVVGNTASTVTNTVSSVTTGVTQVVNTVVAVAPAPVKQPVQQAVTTVGSAVTAVTKPVSDAASSGVVGTVTKPVVDLVTQVPVVGDVLTAVGADDALTDLGTTVDATLGGVSGAIVETGSSLGRPPVAGGPELPGLPQIPALPVARGPVVALLGAGPADAAPDARGFAAASALLGFPAAVAPTSAASAGGVAAPGTGSPLSPARELCPPAATSSGPGGTGSGAWALVALGPLAALRAWGRRAGPEDDRVPSAPAGSTDVSPD